MAVTKRFTGTPLQVLTEEKMSEDIERIADGEGISKAEVVRQVLEAGMSERLELFEARTEGQR